jgi:hypothetical protein
VSVPLTVEERLAAEALAWMRVAIALDAENRQLRDWLTAIILLVARRDELYAHGLALIAEQWPRERAT